MSVPLMHIGQHEIPGFAWWDGHGHGGPQCPREAQASWGRQVRADGSSLACEVGDQGSCLFSGKRGLLHMGV